LSKRYEDDLRNLVYLATVFPPPVAPPSGGALLQAS
jgi:hypothetical protein